MDSHDVDTSKKVDIIKHPLEGKVCQFFMISKKILFVDTKYQRKRNPTDNDIKKMANSFSLTTCQTLCVAKYPDGRLAIIDGGGRWMASLLRDDVTKLPCSVYDMTPEEASKAFYIMDTQRKNLTTIDKHKSALFHGDGIAVAIQSIFDHYGFLVEKSKRPKAIQSIHKCREQYASDPMNFKESMRLISDLCANCSVTQNMLQGVYYLLRHANVDAAGMVRLQKRILHCGAPALDEVCRKMVSQNLKGDRLLATGMLSIINANVKEKYHVELRDSPRSKIKQKP